MNNSDNNDIDWSERIINVVYYFMVTAICLALGLPLLFLFFAGVYDFIIGFINGEIKGPETVGELKPISLLSIIITGCAIGVYGPMLLWRHNKEMWDDWPIQTRIWAWFTVIVFFSLTVGSTLFLTSSY